MKRQKAMLLSTLVLLRKSLRDLDAIVPTLRRLEARHIGYGAQPEHYPVVGWVLIGAIASVAGAAWLPEYESAWRDAFEVVAGAMIEGATASWRKTDTPSDGLPPSRIRARSVIVASMSGRVLIVDDHERFRKTARRALEADGWVVIGEAVDGSSALRDLEQLDADVVLLDVGLPDISGLDLARRLLERDPGVSIVVISTHDLADYRDLALATGARGFLSKAELSGAALEAILGN
jgi:CheY-like chemotaxis protein